MFEVSWGELMVLGVVGAAVTGRKDLPAAFRFVGSQVGRVVGLLQGARARADQYAAQNELKQLQNELRSGLRELDQVRMELAVAASSQGMVGRNLGAMTPSANRIAAPSSSSSTQASTSIAAAAATGSHLNTTASPPFYIPTPTQKSNITPPSSDDDTTQTISFDLPALHEPVPLTSLASHSEKAALEDEWEKQGIGYKTRAEQLYLEKYSQSRGPSSGSELLEGLTKQSLIWDQYDRVVGEQDAQLQNRIDAAKANKEKNR